MSMAERILAETDWSRLAHAYTDSATDTPDRLRELLHPDPEQSAFAYGQLEASVLHQGSLYTATAPAMRYLAAILGDPRTAAAQESPFPWDDRVWPLRASLLGLIYTMAESAAHEEHPDPSDEQWRHEDDRSATLACRAIRAELLDAVEPFLEDPDELVREVAAGTLGHLLVAPELPPHRSRAAVTRLQRAASDAAATPGTRRFRATVALTLGTLGLPAELLLHDPDPAVRAHAALSPAHAEDPTATAELLDALAHPAAADGWFDDLLPHQEGWTHFALVDAVTSRGLPPDRLLPAALAVIRYEGTARAAARWGPFLRVALPDGGLPPAVLTPDQRTLLEALVANDACWSNSGRHAWLEAAGLPDDQQALCEILAVPPSNPGKR